MATSGDKQNTNTIPNTQKPAPPSAPGASAGVKRRGFASLSPERRREIASQGGRAAHAQGTAHEWTAEEARRAGRIGGSRRGHGTRRRRPDQH